MTRARVLIVDDEPGIRKLLARYLTGAGYEVQAYGNPLHCPEYSMNSACTCGKDRPCYDIIITDQDMHDVTGLNFIKALISKSCKCRNFVFVTGSCPAEKRQEIKNLGCKIFDKPFPLNELVEWANSVSGRVSGAI